ncbi:Acetyltransferase (GNAT) domain-containing protein [Clostridium cavendishii DSM 21758]|uniref:Acetyltransferase (GNAT) domain-containing protein n=1 Tax=Clostridium cavendishii DSM 21758 TaxID=1121302 RepID=A0A1M6G8J6_9CLOT|nr:GNAT family N-acetyltransferase [Clostridium cavendishii]SHJ06293.1 Acetyltransferase (GNAT) domain-containing protein [Clostridium cavendishii DSM 21758]
MKYIYIKNYKDNDKLRKSLNELTEKTFCFNFEKWYSNGFWGDKFIPHSLVDGDKVVANVSVNLMDFEMDGEKKRYIQIGTVMTDKDYRGQGLSRYLIEVIIDEYKEKSDGIYLFGNDSVLSFYPKFGFVKSKEYQYSKNIYCIDNVKKIEQVDISDEVKWEAFFDVVKSSISNDRFTMNNPGLIAFWTRWSNSIYYLPEEDTYIIADIKKEQLFIKQIVAKHKVNLEAVINSFGNEIKKVTLGFTPYDGTGYDVDDFHEEDCTLFILGKDLENIENNKLIFQTLSHA